MSFARVRVSAAIAVVAALLVGACGGGGTYVQPEMILAATETNVVAYWHDIGAATVNARGYHAGTVEEEMTVFGNDLATIHLAIYDAVSAIDGRYQPYLTATGMPAAGASIDAAASAAAYAVLRALFPDRAPVYQAAYDSYLATIADGDAKTRGLALGAEVAGRIVADRRNDGRDTFFAPHIPENGLGSFGSLLPFNRYFGYIRPYTLTSMSQFLPGRSPELTSATYGADLNEVQALGGIVSATRTAEQLDLARFYWEAPETFVTRNLARFARTTKDAADAARLMAILYVTYADANNACYAAKYTYLRWRPKRAVELASYDGNPDTTSDPKWQPLLPTPNDPAYPSARSCAAGALAESLRQYYGTDKVHFTFNSTVTGTVRSYATTAALTEETANARIYSGVNFRYSTSAGTELGRQVANWAMQHYFRARE